MGFWDSYEGDYESLFARDPVYAEALRMMVKLVGDATSIPMPVNCVHVVFSNLALHHVPPGERKECARELVRVLRPGGRLVYADMFCDVDAPPQDPARCRDIIRKLVGKSLYGLEHGAYETMLLHLGDIPAVLTEDGEYFTTDGVWREALGMAGFTDLEVFPVPPPSSVTASSSAINREDLPKHKTGSGPVYVQT